MAYKSIHKGQQIDDAISAVIAKEGTWDNKQEKVTGSPGQVLGFDQDGTPVAQDAPDTGVVLFNGRAGEVTPQLGDYTAEMVGALPADTPIPTNLSELNNDSGYITGYTESDPTVPSWAKAPVKPTYTAEEIGALPASTHIPFKVSELENDSNYLTESEVNEKVASLVNSAPDTLNTLDELAKALGDDPNFATTVATQIGSKVDKVTGKQLSTNDFTNEYKTKIDDVQSAVSELFTSVSNGKAAVASAITDKGVTTANDATFETMAANISKIETSVTPTISVNSSGLITATSGDKTATQQLTTQAAKTVTPGTSATTAIASGRYTTGAITVAGDADLVASNIKSGVSIFGVTGTYVPVFA